MYIVARKTSAAPCVGSWLAGLALVASGLASNAGAADIIRGREVYVSQCAVCHGATGVAVLPGAPNFARGERLMQADIALLAQIKVGRGVMPGFQGMLPDRDILSVIGYLRTLR